MGCRGDWLGVCGKGKGEDAKKIYFLAGHTVYVHYFKNIRQRALQSDCVMLLSLLHLQAVLTVIILHNDMFSTLIMCNVVLATDSSVIYCAQQSQHFAFCKV